MVQLRADADRGDAAGILGAWDGDRRLATLIVQPAPPSSLVLTVAEPVHCTMAQCSQLLRAVVAHGRDVGAGVVALSTIDPLLRHVAWQQGFERSLRGPLLCRAGDGGGPSPGPPEAGVPPPPLDVDELARALASLLGVPVRGVPGSWMSRLARSAVAGVAGMARLAVELPGGARPLTLAVPSRGDLIAEGVALTVDVVLATRRRFGAAFDHLRMVSFDHSSHGLKSGRLAGEAHANASVINLNASYLLALLLDHERAAHPPAPGGHGSFFMPPPFAPLERITAHEVWHQIEAAFEARRYRESIELRRRLGAHLGVETLEHAIRGRDPDAPAAWRVAQRRLVEEVSDYAGTRPAEATAEMFERWWCPVPEPSPTVRLFGELVEEYFPEPR